MSTYVCSHLQNQNDLDVAPDLLSDATLLCYLIQDFHREVVEWVILSGQSSMFVQVLQVLDLLLCRLERKLPTLLPLQMENYQSVWRTFHVAETSEMLLLGNLDYAKACESSPKSSDLAKIMSLVAHSRVICLFIYKTFRQQKAHDRDHTDNISRVYDFIMRLRILVPDGYAWDRALLIRTPSAFSSIYMPMESMIHNQSIGVECGIESRFADPQDRYIFESQGILLHLSAEESIGLEGLLLMALDKIMPPTTNIYPVGITWNLASSILAICPSIQNDEKAAAVFQQFAMKDKYNELTMYPHGLQIMRQKRQRINDKL